jgi:lycopene cyclase domain-containing protein
MMQWSYLSTLVLALACVGLVDRRWRLVLWFDLRRGVAVVAAGAVFFLGWDLLALHQGFYRRGDGEVTTGMQISRDLPVEEVFFVLFLSYLTLVLHRLVDRLGSNRQRAEEASE